MLTLYQGITSSAAFQNCFIFMNLRCLGDQTRVTESFCTDIFYIRFQAMAVSISLGIIPHREVNISSAFHQFICPILKRKIQCHVYTRPPLEPQPQSRPHAIHPFLADLRQENYMLKFNLLLFSYIFLFFQCNIFSSGGYVLILRMHFSSS
jgi:hypothetical protein